MKNREIADLAIRCATTDVEADHPELSRDVESHCKRLDDWIRERAAYYLREALLAVRDYDLHAGR